MMTAAKKLNPISVEDYLAGELISSVKYEYVDGVVYAMAGATNAHNLIGANVIGALFGRLRGQKCRTFNSDTKVRIRQAHHIRFYYPDAQVICRPNAPQESFQDEPTVIVEVLSKKTRRTDFNEKKEAYLSISSLTVYIVLEQESAQGHVFRRANGGFDRELYEGLDAVIPLPSINTELPLAEAYEAVEFTPEPDESE